MKKSICGVYCGRCELCGSCNGCAETDGQPFGAECVVAACCKKGEAELDAFREKLIVAFRSLGIEEMQQVSELYALKGSFINLEYSLPSGQKVKFWDDNKIYLGSQLHKKGSDRCYGIAADETYLLVSEYGDGGTDAEIVVWGRWN